MQGNESKKKIVPIVKEEARIDKRPKLRATYSFQKETDVRNIEQSVFLKEDSIDINEISVEKEIKSYPKIRTEGDVTIIPVVREEEVVSKKLILEKEVHITKKRDVKKKDIQIDIRTENLKITKDTQKGVDN